MRRIDIHQHIVPPRYAGWLRERGVHDAGGRAVPEWSAEAALAAASDTALALAAE